MSANPHVDGDGTLAIIAALVAGDRWLSASACAIYLGMTTPKGAIKMTRFGT